MLNFSERLREIRKGMNLTQADFGALAGVTVTAQLNYEKGTRNPDTVYLELLAAHGVDVGYLLTGARKPAGDAVLSEDEVTLVERFRQGSPALRGYLQEVGQGPASGGNTVTIGGDVGQQVNGDQTVSGPMTFNVGKGRK